MILLRFYFTSMSLHIFPPPDITFFWTKIYQWLFIIQTSPRENSCFTRCSTFYDRVFPSFGVSVVDWTKGRIYWPEKSYEKKGKY